MLKRRLLIGLNVGLLVASPAWAVKTQYFSHGTKAEFETGKLDGLVATNFGDLRLSQALQDVKTDAESAASIDALVEAPDGTIYFGTAATGQLVGLKDGIARTIARFGEADSVSALAVTAGGDVLVGVSGETARLFILRKSGGGPTEFATIEHAQYVWGIAMAADGKIYVATGPEGLLVELSADGKTSRVVFDSEEDNLRAIASFNDMLFVGTNPSGLILKVDRNSGKASVVYDAPEDEVSSLLVDTRSGQLYAATSQLVEASEEPASPEAATGRPKANDTAGHLGVEPAPEPKPKPDDGAGDMNAETSITTKNTTPPSPQPQQDGDVETPTTHEATPNSPAGPLPTPPTVSGATGEPAANGNAVYRIEPQGFVSEVFRENAMIFGLARQNDHLLVATGPNGVLYQLSLDSEEHVALAKTRSQHLTSILTANDGSVYVGQGGTAGATLQMLSAKLADAGTFTSPVLDATQISAFGKAQVRGNVPADTSMNISTRSGNVSDEASPLWSDWSAPVPAARFADVTTPAGRYVQYRVELKGNGSATPTLDEVRVAYQQPNVAPRIDSVTVTTPAAEAGADGETPPNPQRTIEWTSTEPNGDALQFNIYLRQGASSPWVAIAKDITEATYAWDTRRVADGRYEIKVEASDALANPSGQGKTASRVADPVTVDNTPPAIGDIAVERAGGKVTIRLRAVDRGGVVADMEYLVDDARHWQKVPSSDTLDDSPDEQYVIVLPDPGTTAKVVSLRCRDESGNTAHESVTIRPEGK